MKAFQDHNLLASVTHVSGVSGGGFAASYLALHPMPDSKETDDYFDRMQAVMARDYFWNTQLRKPRRLFSPLRRLESLKEELECKDFIANATFADLPMDRTFFFNAASYDTGQQLVFSNAMLPPPDAQDDHAFPSTFGHCRFSTHKATR